MWCLVLTSGACGGYDSDAPKSQDFQKNEIPEKSTITKGDEFGGFWLRTPTQPILETDPKVADELLALLDVEVTSYFEQMESLTYSSHAEKLADMVHIDQTIRNMSVRNSTVFSHFSKNIERQFYTQNRLRVFDRVDQNNTNTLKFMLVDRTWFRDDKDGEGAARLAWLIVQHADHDVEFQSQVLKKMESELGSPGVTKSLYAYLHDRVSVRPGTYDEKANRTQRYGTQGRCNFEKGVWEPLPLEDVDRVDRWRAQMELEHLDDYRMRFNCKKV